MLSNQETMGNTALAMGTPPELELPEKHPQLDFTEPAPPSPSYLFDLLPAPHVNDSKDDLSYISHMLLEDDTIDNNLLYQYYPNHRATLLTAEHEKSFAQILSAVDATSDALTTQPCSSIQNSPLQLSVVTPDEYYSYCDMIASEMLPGDSMDRTQHIVSQDASSSSLLNSMNKAAVAEPNRLLPAAKSSTCGMDVISMAFFEGMEEANNLLPPKDSETTLARGRGGKKRLQAGKDVDTNAVAMGRSSKQKVAQTKPPDSEEEAEAHEMLGRLMLNDDTSHAANVQQELLIGSMELEKPRGRATSHMAVNLPALLIRCAEAVATNDRQDAADLLQQIRHHSSPIGDGTQRIAHCFAQGLEARLMGTGSHMYRSLVAESASAAGILKVYKLYMAASSIAPLRFPLTNETTYKAVVGRKKLHVVHYGLGSGFHWPDLLRMLSCREGGPPEVRLTGIDNPLPGFHPGQLIEETGRRLSDCARQFRVPFKFHAIAAKSDVVRAEDLDINPEEVLVVISHFHFRTLMDESVIIDRPNPRDTVLKNIKKMRPKVFIHAIFNGSYSGAFFVSRFREALNNFAALFDALDTTVPQESQSRLLVEHQLARFAMNIIACEGVDRVERPHNYKQWHVWCKRAGLRLLPLDPDIVQASKDKVNKEYRKYIVINEDHGWLLKGWKGRVLSAISTWTAEDDRSDLGND